MRFGQIKSKYDTFESILSALIVARKSKSHVKMYSVKLKMKMNNLNIRMFDDPKKLLKLTPEDLKELYELKKNILAL